MGMYLVALLFPPAVPLSLPLPSPHLPPPLPLRYHCSWFVYLVRLIISCLVCLLMLGGGVAIYFTVQTLKSGTYVSTLIRKHTRS